MIYIHVAVCRHRRRPSHMYKCVISHSARNIGPIEFLWVKREPTMDPMSRSRHRRFAGYSPPTWGLPEFITRVLQTVLLRIHSRRRRLQIQHWESEFVDRRPISGYIVGFQTGRHSLSLSIYLISIRRYRRQFISVNCRRQDSQHNLNCNELQDKTMITTIAKLLRNYYI